MSKRKIFNAWIGGKWKNDSRFIKQYLEETRRIIKSVECKNYFEYLDQDIDFMLWIGHSTVFIKFNGFYIITDPVFSNYIGVSLLGFKLGPKRFYKPAIKIEQLPIIDLTLISHAHYDHLDIETLKNRSYQSLNTITSKNTTDIFPKKNQTITELDWGESLTLKKEGKEIYIEAFRVNHPGARYRLDHHRKANGYFLTDGYKSIAFFGDTAFSNSFFPLNEKKKIDIGLIPISAYDPWIDKHCSPEQAVKIGEISNCKNICPIHHQTFKLSNENINEPISRFLTCESTVNKINWEIGDSFAF